MLVIKKVKLGSPIDLYDIFDTVNYDIFNDELDRPVIGTTFIPDIAGFMLPHAGMYHIAIALDQEYNEGIATMIHEMVHIWQHLQGDKKMPHNKTFIKKCRKAEKFYGYNQRQIEGTENSDEPLFVD